MSDREKLVARETMSSYVSSGVALCPICRLPGLVTPEAHAFNCICRELLESERNEAWLAGVAAAVARIRGLAEETAEGEDAPRRAAFYWAAHILESLKPDGGQSLAEHDKAIEQRVARECAETANGFGLGLNAAIAIRERFGL